MTQTQSKPDALAYSVEDAVLDRYKQGADAVQPALCCPTTYHHADYLAVLPREIIEKDYGCGDPSRYVAPGDTVVDLGSGAGKICYILSQIVGTAGRIIGVDFNDKMLQLARKHQKDVAQKIGHDNVRFVKGKIQDLALDLDRVQHFLDQQPINTVDDLTALQGECDRLRRDEPMIADSSADVVVSNCVLNLVRPQDKQQLFAEIHRVLKRGGRAVISDIVCDENPTPAILNDPELWSGCIAGAFREDQFLEMFEQAGFFGVEILERAQAPWRVIDGVEFRSLTVRAYKGKEGLCLDRNQAVVYKGPWKQVVDDDGHTLYRGRRMAVCDKTLGIYTNPKSPYAGQVIPIQPRTPVALDDAAPFDCRRNAVRPPRETKGADYHDTVTSDGPSCCAPDTCC